MTSAPTQASPAPASRAASAEVTVIETFGRGPLLFLAGSGILWLVLSGVFALIASLQLHTPSFLSTEEWFTYGRMQALRETAFIYGWCANTGLAVALWILGRLAGSPLRALNWVYVGGLFWNAGVTFGLVGIAAGDMTSFAYLQLPGYVQLLMVFAHAAVSIPGILAWTGRRTERMYASQWYGVAALVLFPWLLSAAQVMLVWSPVHGVLQPIVAGWFAQGAWSYWLAPLALAAAYYIVPKVTGRVLLAYDAAPFGFWVLIVLGAFSGGRNLVGGPAPAWISTLAVSACVVLLAHYIIVFLNLKAAFTGAGNAIKFIRFGLAAYLISGVLNAITSFRGAAIETQFTFLDTAFEQLAVYGGVSMILFGALYYMVPRLTGQPWSSVGLTVGHRILVFVGVTLLIVTLAVAGWTQGSMLLNPKVSMSDIYSELRLTLLMSAGAQLVLLGANILLLVNFFQSAYACCRATTPAETPFRQPSNLEAPVA
jgi:cytochrome c oxidase cbb3-type subunit 1